MAARKKFRFQHGISMKNWSFSRVFTFQCALYGESPGFAVYLPFGIPKHLFIRLRQCPLLTAGRRNSKGRPAEQISCIGPSMIVPG